MDKCKNLHEICWDGCKIYSEDGTGKFTDTGGETHEYITKYYNTNETNKYLNNIRITHISDDSINVSKHTNIHILNFFQELQNKGRPIPGEGYINKELALLYNNLYTVLHLRGTTWTNNYRNNKEIVNNFLTNYLH